MGCASGSSPSIPLDTEAVPLAARDEVLSPRECFDDWEASRSSSGDSAGSGERSAFRLVLPGHSSPLLLVTLAVGRRGAHIVSVSFNACHRLVLGHVVKAFVAPIGIRLESCGVVPP